MKRNWPQEIRRERVLANFRPERRKEARISRQKQREGNNEAHLVLIRQLVCCIPGCTSRPPHDPHHLRSGPAHKERGFGMRATDRRAVPACRRHHDGAHSVPPSKEVEWFIDMGVEDVHALADALWLAPRTVEAMARIVMAHKNE